MSVRSRFFQESVRTAGVLDVDHVDLNVAVAPACLAPNKLETL